MKRILHVTGSMNRGGAETMIMNLYRSIDRSRFQFDFVSFSSKRADFDDEIERLGGRIFQVLGTNPIQRMKGLRQLLKTHPEWDTIHCHTLFSNAFHVYAAYRAGVKQRITHSHSTSDFSKSKWIATIYQAFSRKMQARYATHFVSCGKEAGKYLFPKQTDVLFLANSIDINHFAEIGINKKQYLRNEFNLKDDTIIIVQLGRLETVKNHIFSFKIMEVLKQEGIDFRFFIAGQGTLEQQLKEEVKKLDLIDEIHFLGIRTDVAEILAGSNLMLMPSLYEGFPVVLVESQATGVPSLIADTISAEVDLGVGLIHFESLNNPPEKWAKRLIQIAKEKKKHSPEHLNILADKGFDVKTNVKLLEKLYTAVE